MMNKILIAGGSGFIGRALSKFLKQKGYHLIHLVREPSKNPNEVFWNYEQNQCELVESTPIDVVINLSGETIFNRWTVAKKKMILQSRVKSTQYLTELFSTKLSTPQLYLQASAIGYYGNRGGEYLTEKSPPGDGFLSTVCKKWETSVNQTLRDNTRTVFMRFGLVLDPMGGALAKMLPAYKLGFGAILGNGEQYMSCITLEDVLSAIYFIIINKEIKGAVNFVAESLKNKLFCETLADSLNRPCFLKIPKPFINLVMGEAASLLLDSQRIIPKKLKEHSFVFKYPTIESAFKHFF